MAERYFVSDKPRDSVAEPSGATKVEVEETDDADDSVIVVSPEQVLKASEPSPPFRVPPFFASRATVTAEADEATQPAEPELPVESEHTDVTDASAEPEVPAEPDAPAEPEASAEPEAPAEPEGPAEPEHVGDAKGSARDEPAAAEIAAAEPAAVSSALSTLPDGDDRWHQILSSFVDDPRGAVGAASAIVDEEIAAFNAMLVQRQDALMASWQAGQDTSTEDLRIALRAYRDFGRVLVASAEVLIPGN